jgi:hypothetical protein
MSLDGHREEGGGHAASDQSVFVADGSASARAGLVAGDVILDVDRRRKVKTSLELAIVARAPSALLNRLGWVDVTLPAAS